MEEFQIKICERLEYNQFLDMANDAFGYGAQSEWMQINMPVCTPYERNATDDEIGRHYIATQSGAVIGAVGAYPFDWIISENQEAGEQIVLKAYGIGQVCCEKNNRGRGVMRALLNRAISDMTSAGAAAGFLSGDRFRYGRFGFDFGGANAVFEFSQARLSQTTSIDGIHVDAAHLYDMIKLQRMYEELPSYIFRSIGAWEKHLLSKIRVWYIAERDQKTAYACFQPTRGIVEAQGDPGLLMQLILYLMREKNPEKIEVYYPYVSNRKDAVYEMLYNNASRMRVQPLNLIAAARPQLGRRLNFSAAMSAGTEHIPFIVWLSEADNI